MFSFETKVRYSEIGANAKTSVSTIVNYFQDCSTFQSEQIGQGMTALQQRKRGWLLTSWQIDVKRQLDLGEQIRIGTFAHSFQGLYGGRNFIIYDANNEMTACANTLWALVDLETGHPAKITQEDIAGYELEKPLEMEYLPRKIKLPKELEVLEGFRIRKSNLDTNNHVNNGQYIQMAEEYLPEHACVRQMRAEYKKPALYQDIIIPKMAVEDNKYWVELGDQEGQTYAVVQFVLS